MSSSLGSGQFQGVHSQVPPPQLPPFQLQLAQEAPCGSLPLAGAAEGLGLERCNSIGASQADPQTVMTRVSQAGPVLPAPPPPGPWCSCCTPRTAQGEWAAGLNGRSQPGSGAGVLRSPGIRPPKPGLSGQQCCGALKARPFPEPLLGPGPGMQGRLVPELPASAEKLIKVGEPGLLPATPGTPGQPEGGLTMVGSGGYFCCFLGLQQHT